MKTKEQHAEYARAWRKKNPGKYKEQNRARMAARYHASTPAEKQAHLIWLREYIRRIRAAVLAFMGGRCVQCEISDSRILQIDHIRGGGTKERRNNPCLQTTFYLKIMKDPEWSSKYQLLCANCNWIKRYENSEV